MGFISSGMANFAIPAINRVMRSASSILTMGERMFLRQKMHEMRVRDEVIERILIRRQIELIEELTIAVRQRERDQAKIDAILAAFLDIAEKRDELAAP
ncbi:MAG: hypothetical protein A2074_06135 [Candidatus Aquicultor primus]|uniref:Uncharacterized protein n=1 Tax=Candidatus Aquicultor primus TaxID=1797195 RepID=A0A1F2UTM4_9ACTN|nr:MAG: hypothetical protein A2074_06135 [Candidatus Aquicultor primus]HCG99426.1 hypothetical protein [Actinomycetota bacterium]